MFRITRVILDLKTEVGGSYDHSNEAPGYVKGGEFID